MIIEDYTDLLSHICSLGYQDTQKISLKIYSPDLSLFLEEDLRLYINLEYKFYIVKAYKCISI